MQFLNKTLCRKYCGKRHYKVIMLVFISYIVLLCTSATYGANLLPLDAATEKKVQYLVKELHKAEEELESLAQEAEKKYPDLKKYKNRYKEVSEWYWGKRMDGWEDMAPDLYGSDPSEKDARFKVFERAKYFAFYIYLCELAESSDKDNILKWYFSSKKSKDDFAKKIGITFSDSEDFFHKLINYLSTNKVKFKQKALAWRQKYKFITSNVWEQAYKDASSEFEIDVLSVAISKLTPQDVKEAENKVKKIRRELEQTWPDWDETYKEFKPEVDRLIEEETVSLLNTDNFQQTIRGSVEDMTEKNEKITQCPVEITKVEKVTQLPAETTKLEPIPPLHKTEASVFKSRETYSYWWYAVPIVGIVLGFIVFKKRILRKTN